MLERVIDKVCDLLENKVFLTIVAIVTCIVFYYIFTEVCGMKITSAIIKKPKTKKISFINLFLRILA